MGYKIDVQFDCFDDAAEAHNLVHIVDSLCQALSEANAQYLLANPGIPLIYWSGVYYREEPPGKERFYDIPRVLKDGYADCEDLASWRAAELVVRFGIPAEPFTTYQLLDDMVLFHVQVKTPWGIEDPSVILGMKRLGEP